MCEKHNYGINGTDPIFIPGFIRQLLIIYVYSKNKNKYLSTFQ